VRWAFFLGASSGRSPSTCWTKWNFTRAGSQSSVLRATLVLRDLTRRSPRRNCAGRLHRPTASLSKIGATYVTRRSPVSPQAPRDTLRLRVGQKTIARCRRNHPRDRPRRGHPARAALEDPAFVKFSEVARRHARRRKMRLVDVTRNWPSRDAIFRTSQPLWLAMITTGRRTLNRCAVWTRWTTGCASAAGGSDTIPSGLPTGATRRHLVAPELSLSRDFRIGDRMPL